MPNTYEDSEIDPVLRVVCTHWMTKIINAKEHKKKVFQEAANECLSFYSGPRNWNELMCGPNGMNNTDETVDPMFKVTVNKTFEFVTIFGPAMYYENPVRTVKPRMPVIVPPIFFGQNIMLYQSLIQAENQRIQLDGLKSVLLEAYLNWTPIEFSLGTEARMAIDEALIKGRGCLWTELYQPPGSDIKIVRSFWDSTDNLLCDPDSPSFNRCKWIARKRMLPVWQVERDFGLRKGSLKGNVESMAKQADIDVDEDMQYDRKRGYTNDLIVYWEIYSKMGIGGRLQGIRKDLSSALNMFGDYCYLAIAENTPFPLNLSPDDTNDPQFTSDPTNVFSKVAWPTPFWGDDDWPVSVIDFHTIHNCPWPMPHLKAGMGELKFLNWAMSFLMGKVRNTSRDFIAIKKEAGEEIKTTILEGRDLTLIELEATHGTISELVQFLQHPEVNGDIWKMIEAVEANFDKRVGLTELMYGQQGATQIRSAQEANLRNQNMNVRPDDMKKCVEAWMTRVSAKEAIAARYHLTAQDVLPVFGQMGAWAWGQFVMSRDINDVCRQLQYRIEAGSTARPNKEWEVKSMTDAFTSLSPIFQQYAQLTGDMTPLNNIITDLVKSRDLDPGRYQLRSPMPAPMPPGGPPGAPGQGGDPSQGGGSTAGQSPATTNIPPPG